MRLDDLSLLLQPPPSQPVRYAQAKLLDWDPGAGSGSVDFRGVTVDDVPILGRMESFALQTGDTVGMLGWAPESGGLGSWWILGRILRSSDETDLVMRGGRIVVETEDGLLVRDGGDLLVDDGGAIIVDGGQVVLRGGDDLLVDDGGDIRVSDGGRVEVDEDGQLIARHPNGQASAVIGPIHSASTGERQGSGILLQTEDGTDYFRCRTANPDGSDVNAILMQSDESITIDAATGLLVRLDTGSIGDNVIHNGSVSELLRDTSSAAAKVDLEDLSISPADVLALRPRVWRDRRDVEQHPDSPRWGAGLVAEEVDQTPLGPLFCGYTPDGQPETVRYPRLTVALLELCRDQQRRIEELEARVAAIDGQQAWQSAVTTTVKPRGVAAQRE